MICQTDITGSEQQDSAGDHRDKSPQVDAGEVVGLQNFISSSTEQQAAAAAEQQECGKQMIR